MNIFINRGFLKGSGKYNRLEFLRCSLLKLQRNLMSYTPTDVFIWTINSTSSNLIPIIPDWFNSTGYLYTMPFINDLLAFPNMYVVSIPTAVWKIPCGYE